MAKFPAMLAICAIVCGLVTLGSGHTYKTGECPTVEPMSGFNMQQIRNRLSSFSVDPFDLSIIDQTGCPKEGEAGFNIHIDSNTFSTKNIANVFRKAGEKIGDGFEYAVNAGKKIYHQYTDSGSTEQGTTPSGGSGHRVEKLTMPQNPDAEWLP